MTTDNAGASGAQVTFDDAELARLEVLEREATIDPWVANGTFVRSTGYLNGHGEPYIVAQHFEKEDAAFIAAARNAFPRLLTAARELNRVREINRELGRRMGCLEPDENGNSVCDPPCLACVATSDHIVDANKKVPAPAARAVHPRPWHVLPSEFGGDPYIVDERGNLIEPHEIIAFVNAPGAATGGEASAVENSRLRDALTTFRDALRFEIRHSRNVGSITAEQWAKDIEDVLAREESK